MKTYFYVNLNSIELNSILHIAMKFGLYHTTNLFVKRFLGVPKTFLEVSKNCYCSSSV